MFFVREILQVHAFLKATAEAAVLPMCLTGPVHPQAQGRTLSSMFFVPHWPLWPLFLGSCYFPRVMSSSPPLPALSTSPAGLAPTEGIPMAAQAVLHREILHAHASLNLICVRRLRLVMWPMSV